MKLATREYNIRAVYEWFNNPFPADFGSLAFNLPPITIFDITHLDKRPRYTPDLLPSDIYIASEKSMSTLNTPSDSPQLLVLTSDYPNHCHATKKY